MKRAMLSTLTLIVLAVLVGCTAHHRGRPCACANGDGVQATEDGQCPDECTCPVKKHRCPLCALGARRHAGEEEDAAAAAAGPAAGAVTYPYYTTRGPRDFLAKNPPSIGP